ncbi:MAG: hypothetical protein JNK29_04925 [Anaerolineales bacterium]|nr:hypothetical protein [Anaerolineales bacterium]
MSFQVGERVAYPAFGLGRVIARVTKSFFDAETQEFYEVAGEYSTVWVQVNEAEARGRRRLTRREELPRYQAVLAAAPAAVSADARQRQRDLAARLKRDTFQDLCEIVRDLSAYGRAAPLNAEDAAGLQKSRRWLCQEWAAAAGIPFEGATAEVDRLLEAGRRLSPTPTARSK